MTYNTVSVGATATAIIAAANNRRGLIISNASTQTVYIGPDASITTANAIPLLPNSSIHMDTQFMWRGAIYGIVASDTADVRYWWWAE